MAITNKKAPRKLPKGKKLGGITKGKKQVELISLTKIGDKSSPIIYKGA